MVTKVMVFGTFDILHKGHEFYISKAKKYGDYIIAVIARDSTVINLKKIKPINNENKRVEILKSSQLVDKVVLGNLDDKYKIIEEYRPDILVFGYDQRSFNIGVEKELKKRGITATKIVHITQSFEPNIYKSSKLRANVSNK